MFQSSARSSASKVHLSNRSYNACSQVMCVVLGFASPTDSYHSHTHSMLRSGRGLCAYLKRHFRSFPSMLQRPLYLLPSCPHTLNKAFHYLFSSRLCKVSASSLTALDSVLKALTLRMFDTARLNTSYCHENFLPRLCPVVHAVHFSRQTRKFCGPFLPARCLTPITIIPVCFSSQHWEYIKLKEKVAALLILLHCLPFLVVSPQTFSVEGKIVGEERMRHAVVLLHILLERRGSRANTIEVLTEVHQYISISKDILSSNKQTKSVMSKVSAMFAQSPTQPNNKGSGRQTVNTSMVAIYHKHFHISKAFVCFQTKANGHKKTHPKPTKHPPPKQKKNPMQNKLHLLDSNLHL